MNWEKELLELLKLSEEEGIDPDRFRSFVSNLLEEQGEDLNKWWRKECREQADFEKKRTWIKKGFGTEKDWEYIAMKLCEYAKQLTK